MDREYILKQLKIYDDKISGLEISLTKAENVGQYYRINTELQQLKLQREDVRKYERFNF